VRRDHLAAKRRHLAVVQVGDSAESGAVFVASWDVPEEIANRVNAHFGEDLRRRRTHSLDVLDFVVEGSAGAGSSVLWERIHLLWPGGSGGHQALRARRKVVAKV